MNCVVVSLLVVSCCFVSSFFVSPSNFRSSCGLIKRLTPGCSSRQKKEKVSSCPFKPKFGVLGSRFVREDVNGCIVYSYGT